MVGSALLLTLLAAAQQAAPKPQDRKVLQELWRPNAVRIPLAAGGRLLIITSGDPELLPDRALARVDPYLATIPRRSPGDLSTDYEDLMGEAPPTGATTAGLYVFVERGRWKLEATLLEEPTLPLIHGVEFTFNPREGQLQDVQPLLARAQPIRRRAMILPADPKFDPVAMAEPVRRLAAALGEFKALLDPVSTPADALPEGITDRMSVAQMPADYAQREEKRGLLKKADVSKLIEAMGKIASPHWLARLKSPFWQTGIAMGRASTQYSPAGFELQSNPPAYSFLFRSVFGRSAELVSLARRRFGVELYLYERTLLADLTDQTWSAYRRHAAGDPKIWEDWKKIFVGHVDMLKHCNDAVVTLEDEQLKESYVALTGGVRIIPPPETEGDPKKKVAPKKPEDPKGLPFLKVVEFTAAVDAKISGDDKQDIEKLRNELVKLLPLERTFQ